MTTRNQKQKSAYPKGTGKEEKPTKPNGVRGGGGRRGPQRSLGPIGTIAGEICDEVKEIGTMTKGLPWKVVEPVFKRLEQVLSAAEKAVPLTPEEKLLLAEKQELERKLKEGEERLKLLRSKARVVSPGVGGGPGGEM